MRKSTKQHTKTGYLLFGLLAIYFTVSILVVWHSYADSIEPRVTQQPKVEKITTSAPKKRVTVKEPPKKIAKATENKLWQEPTGGKYPTLSTNGLVKVHVNLTDQKLYLYDGDQKVYTMVISSGLADKDNQTPTGKFEIQNVRGESFFNAELGEGALNYVSFKDYGVYLFHSVPVNEKLEVNVAEAEKLGEKASHGCIRLSVPDAKWFYDTIQVGTPVEIVN